MPKVGSSSLKYVYVCCDVFYVIFILVQRYLVNSNGTYTSPWKNCPLGYDHRIAVQWLWPINRLSMELDTEEYN